ncbi:hypothetical protein BASA81_015126 [Batrachochytrium salamandrivorans]|nr:hypothetical protein BASA62_005503 [Batrachochytrium salamandrivorans]KAH9247284.1 hypothetical protein BASA81_015126 [Batrachochytrium salamandrivorans]
MDPDTPLMFDIEDIVHVDWVVPDSTQPPVTKLTRSTPTSPTTAITELDPAVGPMSLSLEVLAADNLHLALNNTSLTVQDAIPYDSKEESKHGDQYDGSFQSAAMVRMARLESDPFELISCAELLADDASLSTNDGCSDLVLLSSSASIDSTESDRSSQTDSTVPDVIMEESLCTSTSSPESALIPATHLGANDVPLGLDSGVDALVVDGTPQTTDALPLVSMSVSVLPLEHDPNGNSVNPIETQDSNAAVKSYSEMLPIIKDDALCCPLIQSNVCKGGVEQGGIILINDDIVRQMAANGDDMAHIDPANDRSTLSTVECRAGESAGLQGKSLTDEAASSAKTVSTDPKDPTDNVPEKVTHCSGQDDPEPPSAALLVATHDAVVEPPCTLFCPFGKVMSTMAYWVDQIISDIDICCYMLLLALLILTLCIGSSISTSRHQEYVLKGDPYMPVSMIGPPASLDLSICDLFAEKRCMRLDAACPQQLEGVKTNQEEVVKHPLNSLQQRDPHSTKSLRPLYPFVETRLRRQRLIPSTPISIDVMTAYETPHSAPSSAFHTSLQSTFIRNALTLGNVAACLTEEMIPILQSSHPLLQSMLGSLPRCDSTKKNPWEVDDHRKQDTKVLNKKPGESVEDRVGIFGFKISAQSILGLVPVCLQSKALIRFVKKLFWRLGTSTSYIKRRLLTVKGQLKDKIVQVSRRMGMMFKRMKGLFDTSR